MAIFLKRGNGGKGAPEEEINQVIQLQTNINNVGAMLIPDGDYGPATELAVRKIQNNNNENVTGEVSKKFFKWSTSLKNPFPKLHINGTAYIANAETGGRRYYDKHARFPHHPTRSSGITIGIGFDLGHNSEETFKKMWGDVLPAKHIKELLKDTKKDKVKRGSAKRTRQLITKGIVIEFEQAWQVFINSLLPDYYDHTQKLYPSISKLPPYCRSALVSLVFNRGYSLSSKSKIRRTEMSNIKRILDEAEQSGINEDERFDKLSSIEDEFIRMKSLWKSNSGLPRRRQEEANMWRDGINLARRGKVD